MTGMELDPIFTKALALLRSRSKDSTDQLKQMLDDVLGKTSGKLSSKPASPSVTASRSEIPTKKTTVKRPAEKSSFGAALSSGDTGVVAKKAKIEAEVRQSKIQPRKPVIDDDDDDDHDHSVEEDDDDDDTDDDQTEEKEENTSQSSEEEDDERGSRKAEEKLGASVGDDDEMWLGLACVVCKDLDISAGNTLIECQECHNLYHQKCHTPPVTDADPNDPRLVWYCAKCKRNMKKLVAKKPANLPETVITSGLSSSSSSSSSSSTSGKEQDKNQDQTSPMNLFRRADPKPSPTSTSSGQQPFGGLASFAAHLTNRQNSSSSKSSASGSSRIITSTGAKIAPSSITSRSSSTSGTVTTMSGKLVKPQSVQRSTSVLQSGKWPSAPSGMSATAKTTSSSSASGKALPQTSTASAMKRLHMMKKKASKR
ncbi:integrator complex subunit 12-like isoform X2 [Lytechinus variegatus]|uniref:integrator complex subunit 12-like isoform X2 n=1 Tax=Lytechinus variegatus TaxID=7654 RepID=UPI001BB1F146|nr:integrator complex subunit 12-like isoform X2 [Lytechinus variegatus]